MKAGVDNIQTGILTACLRFPYLSAALLRMTDEVIMVPGLDAVAGGAMGVSKRWRLYVDPEAIDGYTHDQIAWMLIHEVWHLLRLHAARAVAMDVKPDEKRLANIAADLEINCDQDFEGADWPYEVCTPDLYGLPNYQTFEWYLTELRKQPQESCSQPQGHRGVGAGSCGSAAHGQQEEHEQQEGAQGASRGVGASEAEVIAWVTAEAVLEANKGVGDAPGGWVRWASSVVTPPKVDWRKELAALVRRATGQAAGKVDYSYRRPSRRNGLTRDVLLPGLVAPTPSVAVVVDTSDSMDDDELAACLSEVGGILRAVGVDDGVHAISCDTHVNACAKVWSPRQVTLKGRGGTDMGAGVEYALGLRPKPQVVIVLTDGLTGWPADRPTGAAVIVGIVGDEKTEGPPWAKTVHIDG